MSHHLVQMAKIGGDFFPRLQKNFTLLEVDSAQMPVNGMGVREWNGRAPPHQFQPVLLCPCAPCADAWNLFAALEIAVNAP